MSYRPNFGSSYQDYNMGYSNASRNFNKYSVRNPEQHGGLGEVEFMLENQRKKFRQAKDKYEMDLDNERKKRIEFENKLIKYKDEFSRREVTVSEMEFKINNLLHQNQDLMLENEKLKSEIQRLEQLYGNRIHQLQTTLNMETQNFEQTTVQYNEEFDKFKKQGQEYVEHLSFELERKIKNLEEKVKNSENNRRQLTMENKKMNDLLITNKLQFEQHIRDIKNKARDEQIKKAQYLTKSYEQKLKVIDDSKEGLNRKIHELVRNVQDRQAKVNDLERDYEDELTKLKTDNHDQQEQINQLNYLFSKVKMELAEKDSLIGRSVNDNDSEAKHIRHQLEMKRQENSQLQSTNRELKIALKQIESDEARKRKELAERCHSLETEARNYKEQYTRLAEMLKTKINSTIDHVSYKK